MTIVNTKLDHRIVGGLQSVITAKDVLTARAADRLSLVGVTGYVADNIASFSNLNNQEVKKCVEVHPGQVYPFYCAPIDAPSRVMPYQFFIQESQVLIFGEEKQKAHAFTKDEFEERFKVGDSVRYFVNGSGSGVLLTGQIVCYTFIPEDPDRSLEIYIAGMRGPHKTEWLFDNIYYQPKGSDHFIPFGVEGA